MTHLEQAIFAASFIGCLRSGNNVNAAASLASFDVLQFREWHATGPRSSNANVVFNASSAGKPP